MGPFADPQLVLSPIKVLSKKVQDMKPFIFLLLLLIHIQIRAQEYPPIEWEHSYGGSGYDRATDILTIDDGFFMVGSVESNDGDILEFRGYQDVWLTRLDQSGELVWQQTYGGSGYDHVTDIEILESGDLILVGSSTSDDWDLETNVGYFDLWALRITMDGDVVWSKSYGGSGDDLALHVEPIAGDNAVICGYQEVNGVKAGWFLQLDQDGNMAWSEIYAGPLDQMLAGMAPVGNDKWFLTGTKGYDGWILMTDSNGEPIWEDSIGGTYLEEVWSIAKAGEDAFVVAGNTNSNNGDVSGLHGSYDAWVVMVDTTGQIQWSRTYGGSAWDGIAQLEVLPSGQILAVGTTDSNNGDVTDHAGQSDAWLLLIDPDGDLLWDRTLGGSSIESGSGIALAPDGIIVIANSLLANGDVSSSLGGFDLWVVKLQTGPVGITEIAGLELQIFPNPTNGSFHLNIPAELVGSIAKMRDTYGRIVFEAQMSQCTIQWNLDRLASGMYFIEVMGKGHQLIERVVIE